MTLHFYVQGWMINGLWPDNDRRSHKVPQFGFCKCTPLMIYLSYLWNKASNPAFVILLLYTIFSLNAPWNVCFQVHACKFDTWVTSSIFALVWVLWMGIYCLSTFRGTIILVGDSSIDESNGSYTQTGLLFELSIISSWIFFSPGHMFS